MDPQDTDDDDGPGWHYVDDDGADDDWAPPAPSRDPTGPRRVSDRVWAQVRREYLAGETAASVCARWGLKVSTLRGRAEREGWRRADLPDPEPEPPAPPPAEPDLDDLAPGVCDYAALARRALARFERSLALGRATDAATWLRLHARLLDLARAPAAPAVPAAPRPPAGPHPVDQLSAALQEIEAVAREAAALAPDDLAGRARLDARATAITARIDAVTARLGEAEAGAESDSLDSFDPVFSVDGVEAPADPP